MRVFAKKSIENSGKNFQIHFGARGRRTRRVAFRYGKGGKESMCRTDNSPGKIEGKRKKKPVLEEGGGNEDSENIKIQDQLWARKENLIFSPGRRREGERREATMKKLRILNENLSTRISKASGDGNRTSRGDGGARGREFLCRESSFAEKGIRFRKRSIGMAERKTERRNFR